MRIDRLEVQNFKKFDNRTFDFHPQFTVLVGENGSGKTSILDALAVAMGVWLVTPPDSEVRNSGRKILSSEVRLEASQEGDRRQFREKLPTRVTATGKIADREAISWTRQNLTGAGPTNESLAKEALGVVREVYRRDQSGEKIICPVLAYYGAGRAWIPSNERVRTVKDRPARRWAAFYDCFNERIRFAELRRWFRNESIAAVNRQGRMRPGYEVVKRAILSCVPESDGVWFDPDREQIVISIRGNPQPYDNLSAGQSMMVAMVADIAIKAVTQNAFLLPEDITSPEEESLSRLLNETPGIVLIDELDVHLHPNWQRRVATDLKRNFPAIQFISTSHSPQVIGEVSREEVRLLYEDRVELPPVAFGADSNWILDHVMQGDARSESLTARRLQNEIEEKLEEGDLDAARESLARLREMLEGDTGELVRLESSLHALERLARGVEV